VAALSDSGGSYVQHLRAVGDDLARAARDRDHREATRLQYAGAGDDIGGEQQVLDRIDAHDAKLTAHAIEHAIVADQRAGVRLRRSCGYFGEPDLQHDDRLCRSNRAARRGDEAGRVADRLGEQRDRAHLGLLDQVVDERGTVEIGLVAGRNHVRQADLVLRCQA